MTERTFAMIKPDGVARGLVGEIIGRIERKGLTIAAMRMLTVDTELASQHYAEHVGKPFYDGLVDFITSGPSVAMVLEGPDAIAQWRTMMGKTDPVHSEPGSIRGDLATFMQQNVVHGSDAVHTATREIELYFPDLG